MQTVSPQFLAAIQRTHQIATRFEVWSGIGGSLLDTIDVQSGSATEDVANQVRRVMSLTLTDPKGELTSGTLLTPYGNEIRPYRGITYADGSTELVPLGVFGITDVELADTPADYGITVAGSDRSDLVSRSKIRDYYSIAAGTDLGQAIMDLVTNQVPAHDDPTLFNFVSTQGYVTPGVTLQVGDDPWAGAVTLAQGGGFDLWYDYVGVLNLAPIPDPAKLNPVWDYVDDTATSIMAALDTKRSNRQVFNHIIVISSGTGIATPLRAEAWDANPNSPTFIGYNYGTPAWQPSAYGDVINVLNISTATTQKQAQAAADAALRQALGLTQSVSIAALVNPAHLVNDVVTLTRDRSDLNTVAVIFDQLVIPFTGDALLQGVLRTVTGA